MTANENGLLDAEELKEVLRQLLAEIQHLRVDQAVTRTLLTSGAKPIHLLETERDAKTKAIVETAKLVARIEAL